MSGGSMTVERRRDVHGRRQSDRKWPRILRDFWMLVITGVVVLTLLNAQGTINDLKKDGKALCSFREDLQARADSTQQFLLDHPNGIPGIPASVLRVSLQNELHTLKSLSRLVC